MSRNLPLLLEGTVVALLVFLVFMVCCFFQFLGSLVWFVPSSCCQCCRTACGDVLGEESSLAILHLRRRVSSTVFVSLSLLWRGRNCLAGRRRPMQVCRGKTGRRRLLRRTLHRLAHHSATAFSLRVAANLFVPLRPCQFRFVLAGKEVIQDQFVGALAGAQ